MKTVVIIYMKYINQNSEVIQMIDITKQIEMTAPSHLPQFSSSTVTYYKDYFYITTVSLQQMYLQKYKKRYYHSPINTFKVVIY